MLGSWNLHEFATDNNESQQDSVLAKIFAHTMA